jgi:hypothetical protein
MKGGIMKDPLLAVTIELAKAEKPLESNVALIVGGFLVSGFVISEDKYMEHDPLGSAVLVAAKKLGDTKKTSEAVKPEEPQDIMPDFIHLRDARFYTPNGKPIPGNMGVYCRISLESVDGFTFGLLTAEKR